MPQAAVLALTVAATAYSVSQQRKQAKLAEKAADQQNALADIQNRRERTRAVRQRRIQRAAMLQSASDVGAGQTSALQGGTASLGAQTGSAIGFQNVRTGISQNIANYQNQIAQSQTRQGIAQSVGGLGQQMFSDTGGFAKLFG